VRPNYGDAEATMQALADAGIDYDDVIDVLNREGVEKFIGAWHELKDTVSASLAAGHGTSA
jgi:transaldolase